MNSDLKKIHAYLNDVAHRANAINSQSVDEVEQHLKRIKDISVLNADQDAAKLVWCYEQILKIQQNYLQAFDDLKSGKFYGAWCLFERVEIELHHLERHLSISNGSYGLEFIHKHTKQYQSLYPYSYFFSPGYLILEAKCSVCGQQRSVRNSCGHVVGEIYDGEMCCREIIRADFLEISLVKNPAQKYSVPFTNDPETGEQTDQYDYSSVSYVVKGLRGPFVAWGIERTLRRHPHSRYRGVGRNDKCPCESAKKYKSCCLKESGVLRPHIEILFTEAPPSDLPPIIYT